MAFSTVASAVLHGVQAEIIQVETDVSNGLPVFHMVGYLSSEVKEAAERVRTAIQNCGMQLPPKKIVVNLAPATMRKRARHTISRLRCQFLRLWVYFRRKVFAE